jgi:hypothetical protein
MREIRFEWDPEKEHANRSRHGVSFEEAESVFSDDFALVMDDPEHSENEPRFLILGASHRLRILLVCHAERDAGDRIRIISARKATQFERAVYAERWEK